MVICSSVFQLSVFTALLERWKAKCFAGYRCFCSINYSGGSIAPVPPICRSVWSISPTAAVKADRQRRRRCYDAKLVAGVWRRPVTSGETITDQVPCVPSGAPVVTLTICSGPGEGQSIKLRRVASLLGARAGCKLVLRHPTIDRRHCVIVNTGSTLLLRDLDTRGKTLRNGLKVEQEIIEDADRIQLGPWELKIDLATPRLAGASDSPVIMDLEPDPTVLALEDLESKKLTRLCREVSILGRSGGCDYPVEDREVSRVHAIIFNFLNRPALLDLVSENGTWVNDRRATFAMLQDGDIITLGSYKLRFRSNAPKMNGQASGNGRVLKPAPFDPPPEGTISDFIDFSAESRLQ